MKKIIFLGGSAQQLPALYYARKKDYYIILCDYLYDNPGQDFADEFHCISTTDREKVLHLAKNSSIDGIIAYASDPAAPTAAYVAESLGLPTSPYESIHILTHKDKFREFLSKHDFFTPKARSYHSKKELNNDISDFNFPLVIKPVDSSGSKGVSIVENSQQLNYKVDSALSFSRVKKFIVEEYVEMKGYQVAGDGFSINGELIFRCFANDHFNSSTKNPFVPISASFPYHAPQEIHEKIHHEIQRLFDLLKIKDGAFNFDIRIDKDNNVYIMEVGPRNGGNFIPQVINYATGVDLIDATIKVAVNERDLGIKMMDVDGFWSYYVIHSNVKGRLKKIKVDEHVKEHNIVEMHLKYKVGDEVPAFTSANCSIGILIMKFNSNKQMLHMMDNSHEWIEVITE